MRNKLLNNNLTDSISKGGVLYRAGEIPILTKEQIVQANLVSKLPRDFPFAKWEGMSTKQQLREMKSSGLNDQDQWSLLNSNVPLAVLNEHNQAQQEDKSREYATRIVSSLMNSSSKVAANSVQTSIKSLPNNTPLQNSGLRQKLNLLKEEIKEKPLGKASGSTGAAVAPKAIGKVTANVGIGLINHEEDKSDSKSNNTPQVITIETEQPIKTPRITPTLNPTATPTPSLSEQRAQAAVDKGMKYADEGIRYEWGSKNIETGAVDCSGFVVTLLTGAGFKFGQGNLSFGAQYMANSFLEKKLGTEEYNYSKNKNIPPLQAGDLVFSADADNPKVNKHVMMATGNGMQVVEASSVTGVNKVTYQFDAYKTEKNGRYFRDSGQIITQVIRPKY